MNYGISIVITCEYEATNHDSFECKTWFCDDSHVDTVFAQTAKRDINHKKLTPRGEKIEM